MIEFNMQQDSEIEEFHLDDSNDINYLMTQNLR